MSAGVTGAAGAARAALVLAQATPATGTLCAVTPTRTRVVSRTIERTFFNLASTKSKTYASRKLVGHPMEQVYAVVADVENYHKFVPWCKKSLITFREPNRLKADLVVGFPPINERYTSDVTLVKPYVVKADCTEGRLFDHLTTVWRFSPGLDSNPDSCVIDFRVAFEFRSQLHSQLAELFFDRVVMQMEGAFLKEVLKRHGRATLPTRIIAIGDTVKS